MNLYDLNSCFVIEESILLAQTLNYIGYCILVNWSTDKNVNYYYFQVKILIESETCEIPGMLVNLIKSYLENRKHRVIIDKSYSNYKYLSTDLPRGTVLRLPTCMIYLWYFSANYKRQDNIRGDDNLGILVSNPNQDLEFIEQFKTVARYKWIVLKCFQNEVLAPWSL